MPDREPLGDAVDEQHGDHEHRRADAAAAEGTDVDVAAGQHHAGRRQEGDAREQPSENGAHAALLQRGPQQADDGRHAP